MKVLDAGMKDKLPPALYEAIKPNLVEAWNEVSKQAVKTRTEDKSTALTFFEKSNNYDYGKIYQDNRSDIQKAVEEELAGRPSDSKSAINSARAAADKVGKYFSDDVLFNRYKMVVSGAVMKARNFSQILSYEELNYTTAEIIAILDQKTSSICRLMNGRRIEIKTAASYVRQYMATDPADVTARFGWPTRDTVGQMQGKSTHDILLQMGVILPPYHGNCRTTVGPGYTERIVNVTGKEFPMKNMEAPALKGLNTNYKDQLEKDLEHRMTEYKNLSEDEFASKINSARYSKWKDELLKEKYEKHGQEFQDFKEKDYQDLAINILGGRFNYIYFYKHNGNDRLMFYNKDFETGVMIDPAENVIVNMFKLIINAKRIYDNQYYKLL